MTEPLDPARTALLVMDYQPAIVSRVDDPAALLGRAAAAIAATDAMTDGRPENDVHPDVAPEPGDITVRKRRVGPFNTTDLAEQLAARGIDTLVLAGISTSGVVLSTARHAADHDYRLVVLEDCCADTDPEVHTVLTTKLLPRQADVIDSGQLAGLLGG